MSLRRPAMILTVASVLLAVTATPAYAVLGDSASDPILLPDSLPQLISVDTRGANTEATDPTEECPGDPVGGFRLAATVFFSYTPSTNTALLATRRSPGGTAPHASVYTVDTAGNLVQFGCSMDPDSLILPAGRQYIIMMGTCCEPQSVDGGLADLSLTAAPPPIDINVNVTAALANKNTGAAAVTGTISCNTSPTRTAGGVFTEGQLRQQVKNTTAFVTADFAGLISCDPAGPATWRIDVLPNSGGFTVGSTARFTMTWSGRDEFSSDAGTIDIAVKLKMTK